MNTPNLLETTDNFVYDEISLGQTARSVDFHAIVGHAPAAYRIVIFEGEADRVH